MLEFIGVVELSELRGLYFVDFVYTAFLFNVYISVYVIKIFQWFLDTVSMSLLLLQINKMTTWIVLACEVKNIGYDNLVFVLLTNSNATFSYQNFNS